jgi:hypothetical protein
MTKLKHVKSTFEMINFLILNYIFSDEVLSVHSRPLLSAAHRFKIPRLLQICEDYVGESLIPENVIDILNMATELKLDRLHTCCADFISTHETDVTVTKTFKNLRTDALKDLIVSGILPMSAMMCKIEKESLSQEGDNLSSATKTAAPSELHEEFEDEEMKDAMLDTKSAATKREGVKTDGDFIPDAGGDRKEQVV